MFNEKMVAMDTGRTIPLEDIDRILKQIPRSIEGIMGKIDYFCEISNGNFGMEIVSTDQSWETFQRTFLQTCAWFPGQNKGGLRQLTSEDEKKESNDVFWKAGTSMFQQHRDATKQFSALISSEQNHKADKAEFFGPFSHIRATLDYTYHSHYTRERQSLQDAIIKDMLDSAVIKDVNGDVCTTPTEPWIVFTAGAMGAGKSYTMNKLVEQGRYPLLAFVLVDPDEIRRHLPEFHIYVQQSPELAGELTRKEAGFITEILTLAGLQAGKNVMVDGSLRDSDWYGTYFKRLKDEFPALQLAIIHVTAPREAIFQRAAVRLQSELHIPCSVSTCFLTYTSFCLSHQQRALETGRVVPLETLEIALDQVPRSVKILAPMVTYFCELHNAPGAADIELVTPGETWESFESRWHQTCAWVPSRRKFLKTSKQNDPKLAMGGRKVS
jgi:predicted kinase